MKTLRENPYRLLGLVANSSPRELDSRNKKLRQYLDAGVEPNLDNDYYFPTLGRKPLRRILDELDRAKAELSLDQDKLRYALFWFVDVNPITDPIALAHIKEGEYAKAQAVWSKQVYNQQGSLKPITEKNFSAYHNLSIYLLSSSRITEIAQGFELTIHNLEAGYITGYLCDKFGLPIYSAKDAELLYLNQVISDLEKRPRGGVGNVMSILAQGAFAAKADFLGQHAHGFVSQLEQLVQTAVNKCQSERGLSLSEGQRLLADGQKLLAQVALAFPTTDLKYQRASDTLAKGVFSCGEEYFKLSTEEDRFNTDALLRLYEEGLSFAKTDFTRRSLSEKLKEYKQWIADAPKRKERALVKAEIELIEGWLHKMLRVLPDTTENIEQMLSACEPALSRISMKLGSGSKFYRDTSQAVAVCALSSLVTAVNQAQSLDDVQKTLIQIGHGQEILDKIKAVLRSAWALTLRIEKLALEDSWRHGHFKTNKDTLQGLCRGMGVPTTISQGRLSSYTPSRPRPHTPPSPSPPPPRPTPPRPKSDDDDNIGCWVIVIVGLLISLLRMLVG